MLGALFRWLVEQGCLLANPFAGMKVRGASQQPPMDVSRHFSQHEWRLFLIVADGLDVPHGWSAAAAQRLRLMLDFSYATGLRVSELTNASLGSNTMDEFGEWWLQVVGKGDRAGRVAIPPLARQALEAYVQQRTLPVSPRLWVARTRLLARLGEDADERLTPSRLREVLDRFFEPAAKELAVDRPALDDKLRRATTHWMRHSHATRALERGAELTTVRDNLRHASIATTRSIFTPTMTSVQERNCGVC